MISKFAIKRFLERKLNSFNWMKGLSRKEILSMVADLNPVPRFISQKPLWDHQLVAFLIGVYAPQFMFLLDMGLGKTRVVLELVAYQKLCGKLKAALVVVPNATAIENWSMEIAEHRPDLTYVPMYGSSKERRVMLKRTADLFIINYDGLVALCTSLQPHPSKQGKKKRQIDHEALAFVASIFNVITLDESSEIMSRASITYRVCERLSQRIEHRYSLTGTPFGRDPQALWSQFYFTDHGATLGPTLGVFREAFFNKKDNYFSGGYDYVFDTKKRDLLNRVIQHRSIFYEECEAKDMPPKVFKPIYVPFTSDMGAYYKRVVEQLIAAKGNYRMVENSYLHMRQIASGFIGLIDDETGERAQIEFSENPKMDALIEAIKELPQNRKFLVFHEYVWTGNRISAELKKIGIKHERLHGGQKDGPGALRRFREDDSIVALVVNNRSGAFSLNLQVANYEFFVESPVSPIVRAQAEKRIHRGDQQHRCFYIDFIMKGNSADENIQVYLKEGKDLFEALMKGRVTLH